MLALNPFPSIVSIEFRKATELDSDLPSYDHTALAAVNTCPTFGIVRYILHKRMDGNSRSMALEAGEVAHQVYAAHRLFQLGVNQKRPDLMAMHGFRIFGEDRFIQMSSAMDGNASNRTNLINFALQALYTSGFYDDPNDKNRTVTNISEAVIAYMDAVDLDRYPIWINGDFVGIEIPFEIAVTIKLSNDTTMAFKYCGKIDAVLTDGADLVVWDNKTGSRIDDAWLSQWLLSHQFTGYCTALSTLMSVKCDKAAVAGMRIPLSKDLSASIRIEQVPRRPHAFEAFARWLAHTVQIIEAYKDSPSEAPMYTHSCNRYFRSCSFVPLCYADAEEKKQILTEMVYDKWSPLDQDIIG